MITREEYNKALDIVEEYQNQIFKYPNSDLRDIGKTLISNWIHYHTCSTRLHNVLKYSSGLNELFIDDIDKELFFKFRNGGEKSWSEFKELRGY